METGLLVLGFVAQGLFAARFFVQWIASERARRSVVPFSFWILSLFGGGLLLIYAILRKDPVFILGQASGLAIYFRNIYLICKENQRKKNQGVVAVEVDDASSPPPPEAGKSGIDDALAKRTAG